MRGKLMMAAVLAFAIGAPLAQAREAHFYQNATLVKMESVRCGYDQKSGSGLAGALLGTDSNHEKTRDMECPEYTLESDTVTYRIRPTDEKHPALLPIGEKAEFRVKKDRILLRVPESDDKERSYQVISMTPREQGKRADAGGK